MRHTEDIRLRRTTPCGAKVSERRVFSSCRESVRGLSSSHRPPQPVSDIALAVDTCLTAMGRSLLLAARVRPHNSSSTLITPNFSSASPHRPLSRTRLGSMLLLTWGKISGGCAGTGALTGTLTPVQVGFPEGLVQGLALALPLVHAGYCCCISPQYKPAFRHVDWHAC
jgi:hypothetical protein